AVWLIAGQRTPPLTLAERMKIRHPRTELQVNNVRVQVPLHYTDTLSPLVLRESEATEHVETRPMPDDPQRSADDGIRLAQGAVLDAAPRHMPYADEQPDQTEDDSTPDTLLMCRSYADEDELNDEGSFNVFQLLNYLIP